MADKDDRDNRANQLNPNNSAYWTSRGASPGSDDNEEPEAIGISDSSAYIATPEIGSLPDRSPAPELIITSSIPERAALHYITVSGKLGGLTIEAESRATLIAACDDLWGSSNFLYLKVLSSTETIFLKSSECVSEDSQVRRKVAEAMKKAKDFPKSDHPLFPHELLLTTNTLTTSTTGLSSFKF